MNLVHTPRSERLILSTAGREDRCIVTLGKMIETSKEILGICRGLAEILGCNARVNSAGNCFYPTHVLVADRSNGESVIYFGDESVKEHSRMVDHGVRSFLFNLNKRTVTTWQRRGSVGPEAVNRAEILAAALTRALKKTWKCEYNS